MEEVFLPVAGYEGMYEVSNLGRVRTVGRTITTNGRSQIVSAIVRPPNLHKGYLRVTLYGFGKKVNKFSHRLVAIAFIPNPHNKPCVNHKDGNKQNNSLDNLEWCTHAENNQHAIKTGLIDYNRIRENRIGRVISRPRGYKHKTIACERCGALVAVGQGLRHRATCGLYNPYGSQRGSSAVSSVLINELLSKGLTYANISRQLNVPYKKVWAAVNK